MLPSFGYFKEINCPFFESGLCQRPYCHFRHTKKDPQNNAIDKVENGTILQRLVTEAVKKVLQKTETSHPEKSSPVSTESVSVQGLHPLIVSQGKATYNPTPISELEKKDIGADVQPRRHIPVPYTPYRPAAVPIKRNEITNKKDSEQRTIYTLASSEIIQYNPGTGSSKPDPYQPEGTSHSNGTYHPGSIAEVPTYSPSVSNTQQNSVVYVPSDPNTIAVSRKERPKYEPVGVNKIIDPNKVEYNPTSVVKTTSSGKSRLLYEPEPIKKPKYPCFSSDEDEPQVKKPKIDESKDNLNDLDDLETEFDILGQILEEESKDSKKLHTSKKSTNDKSSTKSGNKHSNKNSNSEKANEKSKSSSDTSKEKQKDHKEKTKNKDYKDKSVNKDHKEKTKSKSPSTSKHSTTSFKHDNDQHKLKEKHKNSAKKKEDNEKVKSKHKETDRHDKNHKSSKSKSSEHSSKHSSSKSQSSSKKDTSHKDSKHGKRKDIKNESSKDNEMHSDNHPKNDSNDNDSGNENDFDGLEELANNELSASDEDDVTLECMKIFEEYTPSTLVTKMQPNETKQLEPGEENIILTKKRVSHSSTVKESILPKRVLKPDHAMQAAQVMANRLQKIREYHTSKAAATMNSYGAQSLETTKTQTGSQPMPGSKVRIAYVPNVSTLLNAKKTLSVRPAATKSEPSSSTTIQTLPRGSSRVAHMPSEKFSDRPGVLEPLSSRIPANIRSTYLNMMIDECLKIYLTPVDAYARAQQEELATCRKCKALQIYKNSAVLTISRLRKELLEAGGIKKGSEASSSSIAHNDVLLGKAGLTSSWSVLTNKNSKSDINNCLRGPKFYELISRWVLTEEQMRENGFPRPHPSGERGRAKIYLENKTRPPKGNVRTCRRCNKEYMIDKKGFPIRKEDCIYHPNRKYTFRGESKYQCCSQDGMSDGCLAAPTHVYEYVDFERLRGFVTTMPKEFEGETYDVYALDCEMCYTTHGLDLTRVTVIDSSCKTVYETLIRPLHPIIDYNTTFSGITEESMKGVTTTLLEVQATLLHMFSDRTILVGHSLESDFKVLKLIHNTVVDTSILFPHRKGPPFKRALRNLTSEYLSKIIQNSVGGHDSAEDAMVCMELLQWKLKEEFKIR